MTRTQFVAYAVREMNNLYSNALPAKGAIQELAGRVFDAVNPKVTIATDNLTLTADDSCGVFGMGTDGKVFTLPATASGLKYTFINTGAAGHNIVSVLPVAADGISGTITLAATVVVDAGVVSKKLLNTKSSAQAGDTVTIIGTGVTGTTAWIITNSTGIWAAEG